MMIVIALVLGGGSGSLVGLGVRRVAMALAVTGLALGLVCFGLLTWATWGGDPAVPMGFILAFVVGYAVTSKAKGRGARPGAG